MQVEKIKEYCLSKYKACETYPFGDVPMFFASPFWTKLQNIFGQSCMSKLDKVAKHWPALNRPAKQALQTL